MRIDVKGYANAFTPASSLVSNIEQGDHVVANVNTRRAQAFTTGYNSTGYTVDAVEIDYRDTDGDGVVVNICETNADETPNQTATTCTTLTAPSSFTVGRLPYDAPDDLTLDPATTYTVVFTYSGTGNLELGGTSSIAEDASSLAGWSIRDKFHNQLVDDTWATPGSVRSIRIDIEGKPKAPVANSPTAIDSAVSTSINTAHTFSAAHFNFIATTSGDALSKVHILTLPNRGTLALSGVEATAGDEISKTDIDAGNLKFTPDTGETGQGYASLVFRVEGSSHKSTNGYRMTMDVRTEHDSVPPALAATDQPVLAADGKTLTLTYNEPMKETSTPANDAFTVEATPAGGSEAEVALAATNGVSVSGSTVVLKLDNPIAHNDGSVKVTYDKPGSGAVIEDANGNDAPGFTDQAVTNNSLIPRVSIEALFPDASPAIADPKFKFTRSIVGTNRLRVGLEIDQPHNYMRTIFRAEIDPNQTEEESNPVYWDREVNDINTNGMMTLTVIGGDDHLPALAPNNSATIEIKLPAMGPTSRVEYQEDAYTIDEGIGNLVLEVVSIIAPGVAAPRHGGGLHVAVLTEAISGPSTMLPLEEDSATINVDYRHIARTTNAIDVNDWTCIQDQGCTHTANVNVPILEDDKHERDEKFRYYLALNPGTTSLYYYDTIRGIATILDNDPLVVTNVTVSSTPTGGYYDATDSIEFTVTFNGSVTVTGTPRLSFDLGGQTRRANYASGSGSDELVFSYTVTASDADDHDGISWGANALGLNGGTIKFTSTEVSAQVAADPAHAARGPLPAHKVLPENTPPTASNSAVRTYANTDYTFAARDFKFADTNMDDALVSVKIVTLPASGKGTLKLNNTAIVETALPKTVTETELGQNKLVYSPPPMNRTGEDFASFTFRVSDGDVDSSDTYTMTVYVLPPSTTLVSNLGRGSGKVVYTSGPVYRLTEITKRQQRFTTGTNELRLRTDLGNVSQLRTSLVGRSPPDAGAGSRHPQRQQPGTPGPMLFTFDNPSNIDSISSTRSLTSRSALRNLQTGLSAQHHLLDHAPCHRQLNASDISYGQFDGREHREEARTTGALSDDALLGRERGSNSAWTYTTDDFDPSR